MHTIAQVANCMKDVLTTTADSLARQVGFVKRQRKLSGSSFAQGLVFGWLDNPEATLGELAQQVVKEGVPISGQAVDQRFTPEASEFMRQVLAVAVAQGIGSEAVLVPLLQRFAGVYLHDSTVLSLPAELQAQWPGTGTRSGEQRAALKVQVRLNLSSGELAPLELQAGRAQDRASALQGTPLPPGSLRITDLGYFSVAVLRQYAEAGVYFLTRIQRGTCVCTPSGDAYSLLDFLSRFAQDGRLDGEVRLGKGEQLPCRLLAWRVPQQVAEQRRRQLQETARKQQRAVHPEAWALAEWTCLVTNAPADLLSPAEAEVLRRSRWQLELLFKLWKSEGHLDQSRSSKPDRILCEVYAKLLAVLIQHWVLVATCWSFPDRSLTKAVKTVRKFVQQLADHLHSLPDLCAILTQIHFCLSHGCRTEKRKKRPSTCQLLMQFA